MTQSHSLNGKVANRRTTQICSQTTPRRWLERNRDSSAKLLKKAKKVKMLPNRTSLRGKTSVKEDRTIRLAGTMLDREVVEDANRTKVGQQSVMVAVAQEPKIIIGVAAVEVEITMRDTINNRIGRIDAVVVVEVTNHSKEREEGVAIVDEVEVMAAEEDTVMTINENP